VLRNRPGYLQTPELLGKITGDFDLGGKVAPPLAVAPFSASAARGHQQAWAQYLGQRVELTNSIGMKLTLIPPGEFQMGSSVSAAEIDRRLPGGKVEWYEVEHPQHLVRLTRPFYLGTHEVTVADFRRFVTATGHKTTAEKEGTARGWKDRKWSDIKGLSWKTPGFDQQETHPVTCVSWDDAVAFCHWLSREEGRTYRLPTEAEWEYACRAGTDTLFFWGDDPDDGQGYLNGADETGTPEGRAWSYKFNFKDGYATTSPVGRFKPNAFGLCDMLGNVWEWCSDWWGSGYSGESPVDDPPGAAAGLGRVSRGGSWGNGARYCRSAGRSGGTPGDRSSSLGFRVASSSVDASSQ
jgi:formylglycine-generating enzyme required for sulfatase activity